MSFHHYHPSWPFISVFTDHQWLVESLDAPEYAGRLERELSLRALDIDQAFPHRMLFEWDELGVQRIATLLAAEALFKCRPDLEVLVALAPWTRIHGPLNELTAEVAASGVWAVVPKRLGPITDSVHADPLAGRLRNVGAGLTSRIPGLEVDLLLDGIHTPDVMLLHRASDQACRWMSSRLGAAATHPHLGESGLSGGHALDRWLDAAAALFPTTTLRHCGVGVAPWNLDERRLSIHADGELRVGADPLLVTVHADFDPTTPWLLRPHQSHRAPGTLNDDAIAQRIWLEWTQEVSQNAQAHPVPSTFEGARIAAGIRTSAQTRRVLRSRRRELEGTISAAGPFDAPSASPLERLAWLRADAEAHIRSFGPDESDVIHQLDEGVLKSRAVFGLSEVRPERFPDGALEPGVDVVGHVRSANGLGAAARRIVTTLRAGGMAATALHLPVTPGVDVVDFETDRELRHDVLLAVMNGDVMERTRWQVGAKSFDRRYVIGQWQWETEVLPIEHRRGFAHVDEIWANSTYVRNVLRDVAPDHIPVELVPIELERPETDPMFDRASLGLDGRFLILFVFDYRSTAARKNPVGLMESYKMAFDAGDGAQLVLKSINGHMDLDAVEEVRAAAGRRRDIVMLDGFLPARTTMSLIADCDVYASLHRSEGLGFTMAEAMLLERPVLASAYGGNLDFMDDECAILVPVSKTPSRSHQPPYALGSPWADPDREVAAKGMQALANEPVLRARLGAAGHQRVANTLSRANSFNAMSHRISYRGGY